MLCAKTDPDAMSATVPSAHFSQRSDVTVLPFEVPD
jgi:hypothetical protein